MAAKLIQVCRETRPQVQVVVAPYEADAQLAYLSREGIVDAVVSEDSDTIPFGCKTMIFKLEKDGFCQIVRSSDVLEKHISGFDLRGFTLDMIRVMCITSGCDYLRCCVYLRYTRPQKFN
jgi:exonuclease-1